MNIIIYYMIVWSVYKDQVIHTTTIHHLVAYSVVRMPLNTRHAELFQFSIVPQNSSLSLPLESCNWLLLIGHLPLFFYLPLFRNRSSSFSACPNLENRPSFYTTLKKLHISRPRSLFSLPTSTPPLSPFHHLFTLLISTFFSKLQT